MEMQGVANLFLNILLAKGTTLRDVTQQAGIIFNPDYGSPVPSGRRVISGRKFGLWVRQQTDLTLEENVLAKVKSTLECALIQVIFLAVSMLVISILSKDMLTQTTQLVLIMFIRV